MNSSSDNSNVTEAEYLRREAEYAKVKAGQALHQAKAALVEKMNPGAVVGKHPIIAILSATVAGFVAALLAIPSKEQQELRRLERLHRALHPEPISHPVAPTDGVPKSADKAPLWATILHEAIALLKPILLTAITSSIRAGAGQSPPPPPINDPPVGPDNTH